MMISNILDFNVLLVSPKSYEDRYDQKLRPYNFYPYSVVYLVSYLKKMRICKADFIDLVKEDREQLYRRVQEEHFDLIGFTSTSEARFATIELIKEIKKMSPSSKIVTGGHFFSNTAKDALKYISEIDFVVVGEGEITLAELVHQLSNHKNQFETIDGLVYRQDGEIIKNPARKPELDLQKLEIDYSLIQKPGYDLLLPMRNWEDDPEKKAFPMMLGRGCNNKCIFCIHRYLPYRVAKIESVIGRIQWAKQNLNAKYFMFTDPSFCERNAFVDKLSAELIENNYDVKWYCEGRADIPLDLLEKMRRAGCISIDFAIESGSKRVLNALRKRLDPGQILSFARKCQELGIRASYFTMISLPDERQEDFMETYRLISGLTDLGLYGSRVAPLIIFPGTDLEALAIERGLMPAHFSWYDNSYRCPYGFINRREENMPHYLEHLTEKQVIQNIDMARRMQKKIKKSKERSKSVLKEVVHKVASLWSS